MLAGLDSNETRSPIWSTFTVAPERECPFLQIVRAAPNVRSRGIRFRKRTVARPPNAAIVARTQDRWRTHVEVLKERT